MKRLDGLDPGNGLTEVGVDRRTRDGLQTLRLARRGHEVALDQDVEGHNREPAHDDVGGRRSRSGHRHHHDRDHDIGHAPHELDDGGVEGAVDDLHVPGEAVNDPPRRVGVEEHDGEAHDMQEQVVVQFEAGCHHLVEERV